MEYQYYSNPELGFEIEYPIEWIVVEKPGFPAIIFITVQEKMKEKFVEMVSVFHQPFYESSSKFKNYSKKLVNQLHSKVQSFEFIKKLKKNKALGLPTYDVTYTGYKGSHRVIIRSLWVLYNNKIYILNFTADSDKFHELEPIFDTIRSSFKIFAPKPMTKDDELRRKRDNMLASIDYNRVERNIENIHKGTKAQAIHSITEIFSLASIMAELKGFGPLNHLYQKFHKKLQETGLINNLPGDLQRTLDIFTDLAKRQNLI